MDKITRLVLFFAVVASFAACSAPQRATTGKSYEDDEVYYQRGETYVTDVPLIDESTSESVPSSSAPEEDDYYDPDAAQRSGSISNFGGYGYDNNNYNNNYYNNNYGSNYGGYGWNNFAYQPQYTMMWDPYLGWHLGFNYGYGFGNGWNVGMGYGYGGYGYNAFNNPWCSNSFGYNGWGYNPGFGYYGNGYYGGGYYSPWSGYGGYGYGYPGWNDNGYSFTSVHRTGTVVNSSVNSTYTGSTYRLGPTKQLPILGKPAGAIVTRANSDNNKWRPDPEISRSRNFSQPAQVRPSRPEQEYYNGRQNGNYNVPTGRDINAAPSKGRNDSDRRPAIQRDRNPAPARDSDNGFSMPDNGRSFPSGGGGGGGSRGGGGSGGGAGGGSRHR